MRTRDLILVTLITLAACPRGGPCRPPSDPVPAPKPNPCAPGECVDPPAPETPPPIGPAPTP